MFLLYYNSLVEFSKYTFANNWNFIALVYFQKLSSALTSSCATAQHRNGDIFTFVTKDENSTGQPCKLSGQSMQTMIETCRVVTISLRNLVVPDHSKLPLSCIFHQ